MAEETEQFNTPTGNEENIEDTESVGDAENSENAGSIENTQNEEEKTEAKSSGGLSNLMGPEGIIMMGVAITLDVAGIAITCFGLDDLGILDIFGMIIICGWMLFRGQGKLHITTTKGTQQQAENFIKKLFRGKTSKFVTPIVGELIPYVGALPCWTLAVFFEVTEIEVPGVTTKGPSLKNVAKPA